jgi:hypothetical protein
VIPDEAVYAAAKAYWQRWDDDKPFDDRMLAALEAAAPHMMAEAWDDGHSAGVDHADGLDGGPNPYDRAAP